MHGAGRVLDVRDVGCVLLNPGIPVAGLRRRIDGRLEFLERRGQLVARERLARHTQN